MTTFRGCPSFNAAEGWGLSLVPFSNFYFLVGRGLGRRSKAQEPSCEGAEDQAEAQRLPKMAPRNAGGHQRIRQQQDGCPASQKECRGKGRLSPGSVEHANERVQTADVEESSERGKGVNQTAPYPGVPQCRPEGWEVQPRVAAPQLGASPRDVIAQEQV